MNPIYTVPIRKDPQAKLDYGWNWGGGWLLPGDTITASTWTITGPDSALAQSAPWFDLRETGVWLTGGTIGASYKVTNHIVTAQGREDDRTLTVSVVQK